MDLSNLLAFMAVASLLVVSPGPNGVLIAKTVPLYGKKAGFINITGFVAAFYVHGALSIFGISIILVQSAQAFFIFKMLGAAYLIWVGIKSLFGAFNGATSGIDVPTSNNVKTFSMLAAFSEGFLTNILNPKVSMFYLAAFPQFISINEGVLNSFTLVTAHSLINVVWFTIMVCTLSSLKLAMGNARFKKWLQSVTGVVFIGLGSKLALLKNG